MASRTASSKFGPQKKSPAFIGTRFQTGDPAMDNFLIQVEQGTISASAIINKMLELIGKLADKEEQLDQLSKSFGQFGDVNRKIDEIHTLHFCREYILEKGKKNSVSQKDRFMAQILLQPVRKRKS